MIGRAYTVEFENATIAAASGDYDLFEIAPASNKIIVIEGIELVTTSELQEAQEEWLRIRGIFLPTTFTTGNGTATTPRPLAQNDAACGAAVETVATTVATTSGTALNLLSTAFQVRAGYKEWFPPDKEIVVARDGSNNATAFVLRLMAAVADDVSMSGTMWIRELP